MLQPCRIWIEQCEAAECIFIPKQADDDVGHSDGVVRFVAENRVLINDYSTVDPGYGEKVRGVLEKKGLEVESLPMFEEDRRRRPDEIESAVGIYINYLRVGNIIVLPGYNSPEDQEAVVKACPPPERSSCSTGVGTTDRGTR